MIDEADRRFLALAVELAGRGGRGTAPNPRVGALLVSAGTIVGSGWHERAGAAHAEVRALEQAGAASRGATLFVSLEPCSHTGRTPPCAEALIEAGVARVVCGLIDPDPRVSGRGLAALREAGIRCDLARGELAATAEMAIEDYLRQRREGRAFLLYKAASTLDGRIADAQGGARWITGEAARAHGRGLRDRYGAVLVGTRTVQLDDPRLLPPTGGQAGPFLRCVIDPRLETRPDCRLLREAAPWSPVLIYTASSAATGRRDRLAEAGAEVIELAGTGEEIPPSAILEDLAGRGVLGAILEGGGRTAGRFIEAGLLDLVHWYLAPALIGDETAVPAAAGLRRALAAAWRGKIAETRRLGDDLLVIVRPERPSKECSPDS